MSAAVNAQTVINLKLDKGIILVPSVGPLSVQSKGFDVMGEIATKEDLEAFLKQKVANLPYMQGAFVLGGMVTFNQITDVVLSEKFMKKGKPVVMEGDVKCSLTVSPAKNDKAVPDASPPTELTISIKPTQAKFLPS